MSTKIRTTLQATACLTLFFASVGGLVALVKHARAQQELDHSHDTCARVLRASCTTIHHGSAAYSYVHCALEAHDFSRLNLRNLDIPILPGDMVCGQWRAP